MQKPTVNNIKTEDLSDEQLKTLLEKIEADNHPHAGPMMKMALFTGMRRGELFKLKWNDVNFEKGFITLKDPKGEPDQKIPLNDAARDLLEKHPKGSRYVFPGKRGRQRTEIAKQVRFKTHRPYYYELLNRVRLTGDWEAWLDFFAEAVIVTSNQAKEIPFCSEWIKFCKLNQQRHLYLTLSKSLSRGRG